MKLGKQAGFNNMEHMASKYEEEAGKDQVVKQLGRVLWVME